MENNTLYNYIESWLDGTLNQPDAMAFEKKLLEDKDLQNRVEQHRIARVAVEQMGKDYFRAKFTQWDTDLNVSKVPRWNLRNSIKWLGIFSLGIGAGYFVYTSVSNAQKTIQPTLVPADTLQQVIAPSIFKDTDNVSPTMDSGILKNKANKDLLVAMANTELKELPSLAAIRIKKFEEEAGDLRGNDTETINHDFIVGKDLYLKKNYSNAKKYLLKISVEDAAYSYTQELLAAIFMTEKKYEKATESYQKALDFSSANDQGQWLLLQFYLLDYEKNKILFWKKLNALAFFGDEFNRSKALALKTKMEKMGFFEK